MRLPNGYGSVHKLSGKRRKPWCVRKTREIDNNGKQQYDYLGYYKTQPEALQALAEYNSNPYDIKTSIITFGEVYEKWSNERLILKDDAHPYGISQSNINGYKASWKLCAEIKDMKFVDVKLSHLQMVVDKSGKNYPTLRKLKVLLGQLFEYAIIHDVITKDRNVVEYVDISKAGNPKALNRKPFTNQEIKKVWSMVGANDYINVILMLIYSGVRVSELLDLKKINVSLKEQWFDITESKTNAGIRRVPIADKVLPYFQHWMSKNQCEYLLSTPDGEHFLYRNYYDSYWKPLMDLMGMSHLPHDTRHTCVSLLTSAQVDERFIKKIVGHSGQGVTQIVYTHLEVSELLVAINKI
ncbi:tyrosine-type recombinase/integrase [Ruminiclostridium papyrosolvens]|uniref:Tyr recombinase domain-containing protein n=1 Tax=Ruminiclostridium papyrosolvens C7 TaxID=1330534 RepID=U4R0C3_9FIRM|nr:tyrosine-type recombinase/integrase [Ruminiclostridium papyrosolvens]EPR10184.1 hypothetical protein L323_14530 [Ruminiclostridium papyrosolvens C7]